MTDLMQDTGVHLDLDGGSLTLTDTVRLAPRRGVTLAPHAAQRIEATRELKRELIAREIPIYGVTTGFGDSTLRHFPG